VLDIFIAISNTVRVVNATVCESKIDELLDLILKGHLVSSIGAVTILYPNVWHLGLKNSFFVG